MQRIRVWALFLGLILLLSPLVDGAVSRIEVSERSLVLDGRPMGAAGPYERIVGKAHFAVDPARPGSRIIRDIDRAPRNEGGEVTFSADLYVFKPVDPGRGNGTILFDVVNRGRKRIFNHFSFAGDSWDPRQEADFGDFFLLEEGYTVVWLGWQFDVVPRPGLMRLYPPVAREGEGKISGLVRSEYIPNRRVLSFPLGDRNMQGYPVADPEDPTARLLVRDEAAGERQVIPRERWRFAREENGRPVPDRTQVFLEGGFEPGRIYEVVYTAEDPALVGLGLAGVRGLIAFLKNLPEAGPEAPFGDLAGHLRRALAFGTSQSGRFLRHFLYEGFNQDAEGKQVFDGIIAHIAGAGRGSFNHRFAQPSRDGHPFMNLFYPTDVFPFTEAEQTDPATGRRDGLLVRAREAGVVPRIFYTNSSYEYWGRAASLTHTSIDGKQDFPLSETSRMYLIAGTHHSPGSLPPRLSGTQNLSNPNDYRFAMRALLAALNVWVADGKEPPPSRYPRIQDGTLVPLENLRFPALPGISVPTRILHPYRVDYGPHFWDRGIATLEPPSLGDPYPVLVPQVDGDGNETAGIRLPDVEVPLATYTGWNLRHPALGAPHEIYSMVGSLIPFPRTEDERRGGGDPRASIEARYRDRSDYLGKVEAAARALQERGYFLERDIPRLLDRAGRLWNLLVEDRTALPEAQ